MLFLRVFFGCPQRFNAIIFTLGFFRFADPDAPKSRKNLHVVREELYNCAPIIAVVKRFPYCHKYCTITVQREQFLLFSRVCEYVKGDFDGTSKPGKAYIVLVKH